MDLMNIDSEKKSQPKLLEPSADELKSWFKILEQLSLEFFQNLEHESSHRPQAAHEPIFFQEEPWEFNNALQDLLGRMLLDGINTAGTKYFGYIPSGGLVTAAFADFMASLTNRYSGIFLAAPALVNIENEVLKFFLNLYNFPESAWGALTSGGSLANLSALLAARETRKRCEWANSLIYTTEHCHNCCTRAIKTMGLDPANIRVVPVDAKLKLDIQALTYQLDQDIKNNFNPWILISSLGTTSTGSVDNISELIKIKQKYKLWLHVDAAYGGFFKLVPECQKLFDKINEVDSLVLDPHKSLFLSYGNGVVLVKEGHWLKKAYADESPGFLRDLTNTIEKSPADYSLELSRNARAPRIYLSLKTFGLTSFKNALKEKLALTRYAYDYLQKIPQFEFACKPELTIIAFRIKSSDAKTKELLQIILNRAQVYMSSTIINNKFYMRLCILSFRSHLAHVQECLAEITHALAKLNSDIS